MSAVAPFVVDSGHEGQLVELHALELLCGYEGHAPLGWTYIHGPELAPNGPGAERKLWSDVVLLQRLRDAVKRLNWELPSEAVERVCELAVTSTSPVTIEDHKSFHDFLLAGDVFTADVIHYWIKYKRENEIDALRMRPHPYEFCMYFDI